MSGEAHWLAGLEDRAAARLPAPLFDYLVQGARDGDAAARATAAWRQVALHPRVLRDVTHVDPSTEVLGAGTRCPFGVAPTTLQRAVHPDGEAAMARAVAAADGLLVVSSNAGTPFAEIGATGVRWWVQCYLPADRDAGPAAAAARGRRRSRRGRPHGRHPGGRHQVPRHTRRAGRVGRRRPGAAAGQLRSRVRGRTRRCEGSRPRPRRPGWLTEATGLPVVVKGVLRADDAAAAVDAGAAAVWVSNHGGRQLDRAVSSAVALPSVAREVGHRVPV